MVRHNSSHIIPLLSVGLSATTVHESISETVPFAFLLITAIGIFFFELNHTRGNLRQ